MSCDFSNQFYFIVAKHTYFNYSQLVEMSTKNVKCELCDMTFVTQQEKDEHKKLEHKEDLLLDNSNRVFLTASPPPLSWSLLFLSIWFKYSLAEFAKLEYAWCGRVTLLPILLGLRWVGPLGVGKFLISRNISHQC